MLCCRPCIVLVVNLPRIVTFYQTKIILAVIPNACDLSLSLFQRTHWNIGCINGGISSACLSRAAAVSLPPPRVGLSCHTGRTDRRTDRPLDRKPYGLIPPSTTHTQHAHSTHAHTHTLTPLDPIRSPPFFLSSFLLLLSPISHRETRFYLTTTVCTTNPLLPPDIAISGGLAEVWGVGGSQWL